MGQSWASRCTIRAVLSGRQAVETPGNRAQPAAQTLAQMWYIAEGSRSRGPSHGPGSVSTAGQPLGTAGPVGSIVARLSRTAARAVPSSSAVTLGCMNVSMQAKRTVERSSTQIGDDGCAGVGRLAATVPR